MRRNKKQKTMERLKGIVLTNGQTAEEYVKSLPEEYREVATESIL